MRQRVHKRITVIAERLGFRTTNLVGRAKIVNKIINSFSISQILNLAYEGMMHHEAMTLVPMMSNLTTVTVFSHYIGFCKGRKIRKDNGVITGINKNQFFQMRNLRGKRRMKIVNFRS
jgi:hypothetical protein